VSPSTTRVQQPVGRAVAATFDELTILSLLLQRLFASK